MTESTKTVQSRQINALLTCLTGEKSIHKSLNGTLYWVNQAMTREYKKNYNTAHIIENLDASLKDLDSNLKVFTKTTQDFLDNLQKTFKGKKKDYDLKTLSTPPDPTGYSRERIYKEIVGRYFDLKTRLNYGYGLLHIIKKSNLSEPTLKEFDLFLEQILRFLGDTVYKGQIIVRSLVEPPVGHFLLWLGVNAVWFFDTILGINFPFLGPVNVIQKALDKLSGEDTLIPHTIVNWDGLEDRAAVPKILEIFKNTPQTDDLWSSVMNFFTINPIPQIFEHRVPVDADWLPNFKAQVQSPINPHESFGSWLLSFYFGNYFTVGHYVDYDEFGIAGVRNVWEAIFDVQAPKPIYEVEEDHKKLYNLYQDALFSQWVTGIRVAGEQFYAFMQQVLPILQESHKVDDVFEQVGFLETIDTIYTTLQKGVDDEVKQKGLRGSAYALPPHPFSPQSVTDFVQDYLQRSKKGLVGFKAPLENTDNDPETVGYYYRDLKKSFFDFYTPLEQKVKENVGVKEMKPIEINSADLDRLFRAARKFANEQKVKDIYNRYGLAKQFKPEKKG